MSRRSIKIAQSYAFDAWNVTDHANSLMQNGRAEIDSEEHADVAAAIDWFRQALIPAESATFRIRDAIEYLEALQKEQANR